MNLRDFVTAYSRITSHGWLSVAEALLLVQAAESVEGPMLEVGCYMGRSAMLLAHLTNPSKPLHCVDPWDDNFSTDYPGEKIFEMFKENIKSLPPEYGDNVTAIRAKVEDFPGRGEQASYDFAYLDGDHTYQGTINQIAAAKELGAKVVAVHDTEFHKPFRQANEITMACLKELGTPLIFTERLAVWLR